MYIYIYIYIYNPRLIQGVSPYDEGKPGLRARCSSTKGLDHRLNNDSNNNDNDSSTTTNDSTSIQW